MGDDDVDDGDDDGDPYDGVGRVMRMEVEVGGARSRRARVTERVLGCLCFFLELEELEEVPADLTVFSSCT